MKSRRGFFIGFTLLGALVLWIALDSGSFGRMVQGLKQNFRRPYYGELSGVWWYLSIGAGMFVTAFHLLIMGLRTQAKARRFTSLEDAYQSPMLSLDGFWNRLRSMLPMLLGVLATLYFLKVFHSQSMLNPLFMMHPIARAKLDFELFIPVWICAALTLCLFASLDNARNTHFMRRSLELGLVTTTSLILLMTLLAASSLEHWLLASILILMLWTWLAALRAYLTPYSKLTALPAAFALIALPLIPFNFMSALSGMFFPTHRRLRALWKPTPLPRLKVPRGLTLIELLIVIAIMAISAVGVAHVTSATHRTALRAQAWAGALQLAEDQFALLQAEGGVPAGEGGALALAPQLRQRPLAAGARLELKPGPTAATREVWIHVACGTEPGELREVVLARIVRVREEGA